MKGQTPKCNINQSIAGTSVPLSSCNQNMSGTSWTCPHGCPHMCRLRRVHVQGVIFLDMQTPSLHKLHSREFSTCTCRGPKWMLHITIPQSATHSTKFSRWNHEDTAQGMHMTHWMSEMTSTQTMDSDTQVKRDVNYQYPRVSQSKHHSQCSRRVGKGLPVFSKP